MRIWLAISLVSLVIFSACLSTTTTSVTESKLRIVTEVYPPYNFVDADNNITGQSTEIVQAILQKVGTQADIEVMPLADGLSLAQTGPGVVIYSLNRTPQRESLFKWVGPIGHYEQAFYAKKGLSVKLSKLEDARKVGKVGVYKGDAGNQFLASQGFTNLDESQTDAEALKKLVDGKVQLWLGNADGMEITARTAGVNVGDVVLLPVVAIRADLYIAFSKDVPDSTIAVWQNALKALNQEKDVDGKTVYDKITVKYSDPEYIKTLLKM